MKSYGLKLLSVRLMVVFSVIGTYADLIDFVWWEYNSKIEAYSENTGYYYSSAGYDGYGSDEPSFYLVTPEEMLAFASSKIELFSISQETGSGGAYGYASTKALWGFTSSEDLIEIIFTGEFYTADEDYYQNTWFELSDNNGVIWEMNLEDMEIIRMIFNEIRIFPDPILVEAHYILDVIPDPDQYYYLKLFCESTSLNDYAGHQYQNLCFSFKEVIDDLQTKSIANVPESETVTMLFLSFVILFFMATVKKAGSLKNIQ